MSRSLFSYVVRYDSAFAPNPFHGYCTLATCKPGIRERAQVGDWLVGRGSNRIGVRRGGHLVYAMRVTEALSTIEYWRDARFEKKKANLNHNWVSASGDNIYAPTCLGRWRQLDSYHSQKDSRPNEEHIAHDTGVERILISDDFVYFGAEGPMLPRQFLAENEMDLLRAPRPYQRVTEGGVIDAFERWMRSLGLVGYQGKPWDWVQRRR